MLNKPMYGNPLKSTNQLYKGFWDEQAKLRQDILNSGLNMEMNQVSELDRYKREEIKRVQDEVKEYERTHGQSGNFFKDFKYGLSHANNTIIKPFNKYVAPILSKTGAYGAAVGSATNTMSGIVDKL